MSKRPARYWVLRAGTVRDKGRYRCPPREGYSTSPKAAERFHVREDAVSKAADVGDRVVKVVAKTKPVDDVEARIAQARAEGRAEGAALEREGCAKECRAAALDVYCDPIHRIGQEAAEYCEMRIRARSTSPNPPAEATRHVVEVLEKGEGRDRQYWVFLNGMRVSNHAYGDVADVVAKQIRAALAKVQP